MDQIEEHLTNRSHTWMNSSAVSDSNYDGLNKALKILRLMLKSELIEEAYSAVILQEIPDILSSGNCLAELGFWI